MHEHQGKVALEHCLGNTKLNNWKMPKWCLHCAQTLPKKQQVNTRIVGTLLENLIGNVENWKSNLLCCYWDSLRFKTCKIKLHQ
jgi:hypothetical protein